MHAAVVLGLGTALGAAGVLPRLELNAVSSLAGGYPVEAGGQAAAVGGWTLADLGQLARPGIWYAGVVPLALAAAAPLVARRRHATVFFALLATTALVLALAVWTPLHAVLYAVPVAGRLHPHSPERVLLLAYPAFALLAGATVSALGDRARWAAPVVLVAVTADLLLGLRAGVADLRSATRAEQLVDVDVARYLDPGPAGAWLRDAGRGRYFGYSPQVVGGRALPWAYSVRWADRRVQALLVNNHALAAGLFDIQGYDPVHIARYDALIAALNGRTQNYHFADIRPSGLSSPLLDLLDVRWVVTRADEPDQPGDPARTGAQAAQLMAVYDDGAVRILARPSALPHAWLVHDARREEPGRALALLASGAVDPAQTALLEVLPPPLSTPVARDGVRVTRYEPDRITVETASDAPGLLVLSEIAYPAWRAAVDGRAAPILTADFALRAVPVPAGAHTVELRFASAALDWGTALSALAALALVGVLWATRR